jgi:hypothetical protein
MSSSVRPSVAAGEQAQEVGLAGAVGAEDGDAFAVEDLQVEGLHQTGELESFAGDGPDAGAAALEPHPDVLLAGRLGRRAGLLELAQPGLGGGISGGHLMADGGSLTERQHQLLQLGVFLVPAPAQFLEALEPLSAGLVVRAETTAVHPGVGTRGAGFQGDDPLGGAGEQFTVVGDEEDGLAGLGEPFLQPALAGDVEIVVGLVEKEHLVGAAQEGLQDEPLLLAAGERADLTPLCLLVGNAERGRGAHVPQRLGLVAAGLRPVGEGLGVLQLGGLVVDGHDGVLGGVHGAGRLAEAGGGDGDEQVTYGRLVAYGSDELPHHAEPAADGDGSAVRPDLTGEHAEQGRLPGPVGSHEGDDGPLPDPERHITQQRPSVRQVVLQMRGFEVTHGRDSVRRRPRWANAFPPGCAHPA